jgi:small nuclear ribonucleoprotein (snRNP)-like protein
VIVVLTTLLLCATVVELALLLRPRPQPVVEHRPVPSILDERLLTDVVVTLKSGSSFAGVLYAEDSGALVICKAQQLFADGSRVSADGEVVVLRGDVDFIQRP